MRSPVNAPGAGRDGEEIDALAGDAGLIERARDFAGQALTVRARLIAGQDSKHAVTVGHGHAAASGCCVKSQNDHVRTVRTVRRVPTAIVYSYRFI